MNIGYIAIISLISCFVLTMLFAPIVIRLMKKLHASQSILKYVDNHNAKAGTPTMGGLMFLLPIAIVTLCFGGPSSKVALVILATMLSFGLLGFLDDFIKVKCKHNEGLKAYQKVIGQVGIGIIVTMFAYYSNEVGSCIKLPFSDKIVDFGYWYIPFTLFVFLASTNAVNLTDGLDGLATSTSLVYIATFIVILMLNVDKVEGDTIRTATNNAEIVLLTASFGGLLAFLWHNTNKASIFMGDTGSLALGGLLSAIAVFTRNTLLIPIVGIMYMISCISVIMQVVYFKLTHGKRIFKMAPLHHHLQYSGYSEAKIVAIYTIITIIMAVVALASKI